MDVNQAPVLSVTELTHQLKELVEANFPHVVVSGEISSFSRASSGHCYLTLKDENSQLRAVMWKTRAQRLKFDLTDGLEVVAIGPVEVNQARGSYQLIVEQMLPQGVGALELAFRQMQEKLAAEGLFLDERKQPLPNLPRKLALVTSPTGAAIRDMLQVLARRWPLTDVVVVPVAVQGNAAAADIAQGIQDAHRIPDVDLIITGRGGGSLEDLWPFNEEVVARAIAESTIPVISAVGHEIDVSISDLVADVRALTPTDAAQMAVPDQKEVISLLDELSNRLRLLIRQKLQQWKQTLNHLQSRRFFTHPEEILNEPRRRVDDLERELILQVQQIYQQQMNKIQQLAAQLNALSPLNVLARGYSITSTMSDQKIVERLHDLHPGHKIRTRLVDGEVIGTVEQLIPIQSSME